VPAAVRVNMATRAFSCRRRSARSVDAHASLRSARLVFFYSDAFTRKSHDFTSPPEVFRSFISRPSLQPVPSLSRVTGVLDGSGEGQEAPGRHRFSTGEVRGAQQIGSATHTRQR